MNASERVVYDNGYLNFANLRYKAENLAAYAGQKVLLRYDPRNITMVFVYDRKDSREKFLARAYAVGLEAERLSIEEVKHARKKAEMSGKGVNNISILEEATRRQNFLKLKTKKTKSERRKAEQKRHNQEPRWVEEEKKETADTLLSTVEYEPTEAVDYSLIEEELGL